MSLWAWKIFPELSMGTFCYFLIIKLQHELLLIFLISLSYKTRVKKTTMANAQQLYCTCYESCISRVAIFPYQSDTMLQHTSIKLILISLLSLSYKTWGKKLI